MSNQHSRQDFQDRVRRIEERKKAEAELRGKDPQTIRRAGKRILVVGDNAAGLRTLADIDDPEEVAGLLASVTAARPTSISAGFSNLLGRMNTEYVEDDSPPDETISQEGKHIDQARNQVSQLLSRIRSMPYREGAR